MLAVVYGAYWIYRFLVSRLGAIAPLVLSIGAVPVLVGVSAWVWRRYHDVITHQATRIARRVWGRVERSEWYRQARTRFPTIYRFASGRVDPHGATGLGFSLIMVAAAAAFWAFVVVLFQVLSDASITAVDHRIINLFQELRTPAADRIMLGATYLGSGQGVAAVASAAVLIAILLRRWREALMVVASLVAGTIFFSVVKLIIRRPRPALYDARIEQGGFSFPSGHATMAAVLCATLAVILIQRVRSFWLRVLIVFCSIVAAVWIGLSRVYLGVHYPSDVLAGWAVGVFWALLVLASAHVWQSRHPENEAVSVGWPGRGLAALVPVAAIVYLAAAWPSPPAPPAARSPAPFLAKNEQLIPLLRTRVPRYTEGLFGHRQEPINLVFVGSGSDLTYAFRAAGWVKAERLSWSSLRRAATATLTGGSDPTGPVTPSFLAEKPESLAFNQPVGNTFANRHHIRIWPAPYELIPGGRIWLATASYDAGYAIAGGSLLPVHQIAPDIDNERDYIARNITRMGVVVDTTRLQLVPPEMGTNSFGQPFFTYGQAILIRLRSSDTPPQTKLHGP